MADSKKRLYSRETINKHYSDFIEQVKTYNEKGFPDKILDVVIFGSYINTNNPKMHDLDIGIRFEKHPELYEDYKKKMSKEQLEKYANRCFLDRLVIPHTEEIRFLKAKHGTISLYDIDYDKEYIFNDKHLYIVKNGELIEDALPIPLNLQTK